MESRMTIEEACDAIQFSNFTGGILKRGTKPLMFLIRERLIARVKVEGILEEIKEMEAKAGNIIEKYRKLFSEFSPIKIAERAGTTLVVADAYISRLIPLIKQIEAKFNEAELLMKNEVNKPLPKGKGWNDNQKNKEMIAKNADYNREIGWQRKQLIAIKDTVINHNRVRALLDA